MRPKWCLEEYRFSLDGEDGQQKLIEKLSLTSFKSRVATVMMTLSSKQYPVGELLISGYR